MKMKHKWLIVVLALTGGVMLAGLRHKTADNNAWIRVNLLGYKPAGVKVAVWCCKEKAVVTNFQLMDIITGQVAYEGMAGEPFGAYGPFAQTCRLDFSAFNREGRFVLHAGGVSSPEFTIAANVYDGAADFCLRYMRQQRSGFNPFLKDSCHTRDGYVLYGEKAGIRDSTHIDVVGGWHDASDYLQYAATSANATYHLLMAYRDFPGVFGDTKAANGLDGKNGIADVLDEARWGIDWLLKMHPKDDWMFNQVGDDRDHQGMRLPGLDSFYGKGFERPVYFCNGEPQVRGKFKNNTTGVASTAGKFSSAFSLGAVLLKQDKKFADILEKKAKSAYRFGLKKPGVCQTASVLSPYIYAEDNWTDDMELAAVSLSNLAASEKKTGKGKDSRQLADNDLAYAFLMAAKEKVTPWLGADSARHYEWYPFINIGHYELAKRLKGKQRATVVDYYRQGIERVWEKARQNAFYRGVPFIWCSNNLTVAFATQCYWYRVLNGDPSFAALEQANFDWLFGCNPWGTSFVYGLPANGDTPSDPHSAFTHLKHYPIDGGLVDGPVYGSIFSNLIGIKLYAPDEYAQFQSSLVVYHDDYGDYSTNEPTMDGTASLLYLLAAKQVDNGAIQPKPEKGKVTRVKKALTVSHGAVIRGDSTEKKIALVFTGDEFAEGGRYIAKALRNLRVKASFFFTGRFYRKRSFQPLIQTLIKEGHYLGPHSGNHVLYCDWIKRDSLLLTKEQFREDLERNYAEMEKAGITKSRARFFLPPYEWYNDSIAAWTKQLGLQLINFTPGTKTNADYTTTDMKNYRGSEEIYQSVLQYEKDHPAGLNGFILLLHIGAGPARTDKFYNRLPQMLQYLQSRGYHLVTVNDLLEQAGAAFF
jgi:peptidoglycan/xylan/chitin deacetylase (PgdA/CDA1 family)